MRLDVGVLGAEQLAGERRSFALDDVDVVAAGVEAVPGIALGVLVGEQVAVGQLDGERAEVLAGDEL